MRHPEATFYHNIQMPVELQRHWPFSKTLTICSYSKRKHSALYHCMLNDNCAELQPTHYIQIFKAQKRPDAHIL